MRRPLAVCCALLAFSCAASRRPPIPTDVAVDVQRVERIGHSLFRAFETSEVSTSPALAKAKALAEATNVDRCDVPYRSVALSREEGFPSSIYVFVIGVPPRSAGIMGGRHFRIELTASGDEVLSITPSTKSCLFIPANAPPGATPVAAYMTHVLSATPTEFHVFLSLLHAKPIYVGTHLGTWVVEGGKVSFLEPR